MKSLFRKWWVWLIIIVSIFTIIILTLLLTKYNLLSGKATVENSTDLIEYIKGILNGK